MTNDYKITISRSYSRKVSDGNYGSRDYFASYSLELPMTSTEEELRKASYDLFMRAKNEVESNIEQGRIEGLGTIEKVRQGIPIPVKEYEDAIDNGMNAEIQDAKRAHNREVYAERKFVAPNKEVIKEILRKHD